MKEGPSEPLCRRRLQTTIEEACELIVEAIKAAGYEPGKDVGIALDPAASSFYVEGAYRLDKSGQGNKSSADMIALYGRWLDAYRLMPAFLLFLQKPGRCHASEAAPEPKLAQQRGELMLPANNVPMQQGRLRRLRPKDQPGR